MKHIYTYYVICMALSHIVDCYLDTRYPKSYDDLADNQPNALSEGVKEKVYLDAFQNNEKKILAILVPFRSAFEELLKFVPHMHKFLNKQMIPFHIFIIQQTDSYRYNKASLVNVGFLYTKADYDYIAMHDVDLLPINENLRYDYPELGPLHIALPMYHPIHHDSDYMGGILLFKRKHFEKINGLSNRFWGWGSEDYELSARIKKAGLIVRKPKNITTKLNNLRHVHGKQIRDNRRCNGQPPRFDSRVIKSGLNNIKYQIHDVYSMKVNEQSFTVLNVELFCNKIETPWCWCPEPATVF